MGINDWPVGQRPRERLLRHGVQALSDPELLALFLRVGIPGKNAVEFGRELICQFGSLHALFSATQKELSSVHGLGPAKFAQLQAIMELARRATSEQLQYGQGLSSPAAVRQYLKLYLARQQHESFVVLFLDAKNRLIASEAMFRGTLTQTSVHPREVVKAALAHNAAGVVLAHNHPSGAPAPSEADVLLTRALAQALALVEVRVLDHFIVAGQQVHSFAEHGQL